MSREKVFVGQAVQQLNSSPDWGSYSKVILKTGDGEGYVAGNDTGLTLEADCPYATQAIANAVLASLQGGSYKPYEGSRAYITPAAEIGDGMTSDGFYSGIYSLSRQFSKTAAADIGAPSNTEVQHEIQYVSQSDRKFTRKMKEISSEFAVMADRISAKVSSVHESTSFGWSMTEEGMYWYANGTEVMRANSQGLKIIGTLESGSIITGDLTVGGEPISAATLRQGASDGYDWGTGGGGWGTYASKGLYTLNWSGAFNSASTEGGSAGAYFKANIINAGASFRLGGWRTYWQEVTINGTSYTFLRQGAYTG